MNKTYILGIGSGRCGTQSLAALLNGCSQVNVSHEFRERGDKHYRLSWYFNKVEANRRLNLLKNLKGNYVGDIAHYYLNYIKYFQKHLDNLKIIYLYRDTEEVIESFMRKTKQVGNRCHWLPKWHEDMIKNRYTHEPWTKTFPQFIHAKDKRDAIRMYCKKYKNRALSIPNVHLFNTKDLNNKTKLDYLYNYIGIKKQDRNYNLEWKNKS